MCPECCQTLKSNRLPEKKKKVNITPAQQMLNRFEALQKMAAGGNNSAVVKRSSSADSSVAVEQSAVPHDGAKVAGATKPKLGDRVAHKPTLVRQYDCC